jgi:hypothetical protein
MSISHSASVFVALGIQHAMRLRHIVICGLPSSTILSTLSHKRQDFLKKKVTQNVYFYFIYNVFINISHFKIKLTIYDQKCILVFM